MFHMARSDFRQSARTRSAGLKRLIWLAVFVLVISSFAGEPWDKRPEQWNLAETYQILSDSPWSPAKTAVELTFEKRYVDPLTNRRVELPNANRATAVERAQFGRQPKSEVPVLWWSAKTVRLAQQRLHQLRDPAALREPLRADELKDFVLIVEGTEALRILSDSTENLRETVFLEVPGGLSLDVSDTRFVEGVKAGEDFVEFHFLRQIEGRPTVSPDADRVVFHCKATAKTARPGRPDSISIRAEFEPRKMRAAGRPDL